jgi:APA family basic amino acid/polyamine antiporter
LSDSKPEVAVPQRTLNLSQGVLYGIGCGIGASIFILLGPGISLANVGVLMSLALGALLIFFTALNYAELSTSLPIAGGSYNFSKEGLGGFLAFIIGFFLWIANIAACSFSARTFALVFENLFKRFGIEIEAPIGVIVAIISILFTSLVIFRTQHIAIKTLINLTLIILGIFLFFILSGLILAPFNSNYDPGFLDEPYSLFGVIAAVPLLLLPFTTILSNLAYLNSDFKNPSKNIPKAYIIAITIALAIYLLVSIVVLININGDPNNLSENPLLLANILGSVLGPLGIFGFFLMIFAAFISTLVAINAALGSAVSVVTALTRDRYFPQKVKEIKKRSQMPVLALSITALFAIIFTYFAEIGLAAETTTFIYFFGLAFVNYAAVKLRRKRKELDRPFKAPFFPYLPYIISGFFVVLALFFFSPEAVFLGLVLLSIG